MEQCAQRYIHDETLTAAWEAQPPMRVVVVLTRTQPRQWLTKLHGKQYEKATAEVNWAHKVSCIRHACVQGLKRSMFMHLWWCWEVHTLYRQCASAPWVEGTLPNTHGWACMDRVLVSY